MAFEKAIISDLGGDFQYWWLLWNIEYLLFSAGVVSKIKTKITKLMTVIPLECFLLTANLTSSKQEKFCVSPGGKHSEIVLKIQGPYMWLKLVSKDF